MRLAIRSILSRRSSRFAFPDDFIAAVRPIQERLRDKHRRASLEGRVYREVREIAVAATPAWESHDPSIVFLFIRNDDVSTSAEFDSVIESLMARFVATGSFKDPEYRIVSLSKMTADIYVASDPLDLDNLTHSTDSD